ncbi:MAG: Crp/Fnr family transcriptional regulator [Bacteroidales bacterium]|jgi:CRP/FNR family transcriptional regulator, anaerobic regulatory protein|nr:Crp/Fnr family transcriptional regulator [Bacteroidales bacterium]
MNANLENLLKFINQFVDFNEKEIKSVQEFVQLIQLNKNEIFINEGEIADQIAFTNSGYLRVYYNHDGEEITRDITPLHSFATALPSFVSQTPSFEIIRAITDCELLVIKKEDLEYLYSEYPKWERLGRRIIEEMFVESQCRIYSFITETAETRYKRILKQYPDMIHDVPLKYIADFLGIKLQSLSRLRKNIDW